MRRGLRSLLLGASVWVVACGALAQSAAPAVQAVQVAERVWFVEGRAALGSVANRNFISNAAFVVTDDGVVVIDALGSPALAEELLAEIGRVTPQPVRQVVVTHYHADHIYGLQTLQAAGAGVIAHQAARDYLHSDTAARRLEDSRLTLAPWIDAQTRLVAATRWLTDDETRMTIGGVEFVVAKVGPAHTAEDLVVYLPGSGVLFAGDLVFRGRLPYVGQADSRQWIASLERLIGYHARLVVPGHGPVSTEPAADLVLTRDYLLRLRQTMGAAARNLEPFEDAYATADWAPFDRLPLFRAANRINAYNTYLLMEQEAPARP